MELGRAPDRTTADHGEPGILAGDRRRSDGLAGTARLLVSTGRHRNQLTVAQTQLRAAGAATVA